MKNYAVAAALLLAGFGTPGLAEKPKAAMTQKGMLTLYYGQKFEGDSYEITKDQPSISLDFTIGSVAVFPGEKWELCQNARYKAPCITFSGDETGMGKVDIRSARVAK